MVAVITIVVVPVEEALANIGMKSINVVISLDFYSEAYYVRSLV